MSHKPSAGGGGHGGASGRWLVSYADFITLMMVVFMVLYSMARVDGEKYGQLKGSLQNSSIGGGGLPLPAGGNPVNTAPTKPGTDPDSFPGQPIPSDPGTAVPAPPVVNTTPGSADEPATPPAADPVPVSTPPKPSTAPPTKPVTSPPPKIDPLSGVRDGMNGVAAGRAGDLTVELRDRGVIVSILTSVLFQEGASELKPEAYPLLDAISAQLQRTTESIVVEGAPDATSNDAPWDLSSRRAGAVVSYLVGQHGLQPGRFAVIGYGKGAGVDGIVNVVLLRKAQ